MTRSSVKDYEELKLSTGEAVKVHRVPNALVKGVVPTTPRPRRPQIEMKTAGGGKQLRPAKDGDPGYEEYLIAEAEWKEERDRLRDDVALCLTLKSYPIPEGAKLQSEIQELVDFGFIRIPDNPWSRKAAWLRANVVVGQADELDVEFLQQKLGGIPEEVIEQMKENFRNSLLGKAPEPVGAGTDNSAEQTDAADEE